MSVLWLKQSTAVDVPIGPFLDATDGVTAETGLTISQADVRLKKNAAAWAQKNDSNAATHEENGNYECPLDATDTNTLGRLRLHVAESGAGPVWHDYMVVPAEVYDTLVAGTDNLTADLTSTAKTEAADVLLNRDMSTGTDSGSSTVRTVRQALRFLRNKVAISAGTMTVYKEDDSTSSFTAAVTTDAAAVPIVSVDPAGP
jgi:hypothetical protein